MTKIYWAFVEGQVEPDEGTWTDYLHKRHGMAQAEVVDADHPAPNMWCRTIECAGEPNKEPG